MLQNLGKLPAFKLKIQRVQFKADQSKPNFFIGRFSTGRQVNCTSLNHKN
jgi:hypothetical protein